MGMGCGISMVKYILFVFNLICALCGIAILAIGITIHLKMGDFKENFQDYNLGLTPILFIVLGAVIFVIAFFGCCGAINESRCMTAVYSSLLLLILIIQIVFGVMIFMNIDVLKEYSGKVVEKMWAEREKQMKFWDSLQSNLKCCGTDSPLQWGLSTPKSCCPDGTYVCTALNAYQDGCIGVMREFVESSGLRIGYIALIVAAVELLGVIFACCLVNSIRNQERRYA